jgi:hypothetical protein
MHNSDGKNTSRYRRNRWIWTTMTAIKLSNFDSMEAKLFKNIMAKTTPDSPRDEQLNYMNTL